MHFRTWFRSGWGIFALGTILVLAGGVAGLGWLAWPTTSWARDLALAQAEQRWAVRTFGHYRLDLMDKRCTLRIEIRNERVLDVAPNRCESPPRSISDLFGVIRRDGTLSRSCVFQGCVCDDIWHVQASFDETLGYPARIIVRIRAEPNWQHSAFWQRAWRDKRLPDCTGMVEGSKIIQVLKITPLGQP